MADWTIDVENLSFVCNSCAARAQFTMEEMAKPDFQVKMDKFRKQHDKCDTAPLLNSDSPFQPGEHVEWEGTHGIVLKNLGDHGEVDTSYGNVTWYWVHDGRFVKRSRRKENNANY